MITEKTELNHPAVEDISGQVIPEFYRLDGSVTITDQTPQKPLTKADITNFSDLYEIFSPKIQRYLTRTVGNVDEAADLTQDTLLKVLGHLDGLPDDAKITPWIYRIATRTLIDHLRHERQVSWQPLEDYLVSFHLSQVDPKTTEQVVLDQETRSTVVEAFNQLTANHRSVLVLLYYGGLSCSEIGDIIGTTKVAIKSMLSRARANFKVLYEALERGEELTVKKGKNRFA